MRGARRFWRQGPRARGRCLGFFELSQLHMSPYGDHGVVEGMGHGKILHLCQGQLKFFVWRAMRSVVKSARRGEDSMKNSVAKEVTRASGAENSASLNGLK